MTDKQRQHLEQRLLKERERAVSALEQFDERANRSADADGDLTNYPFHLADEGTDTMEREKDFLLASKEGRQLYAIDAALRTLYRSPEGYGKCQNCGREISFERLDIVPWATYCKECQEASETAEVGGAG